MVCVHNGLRAQSCVCPHVMGASLIWKAASMKYTNKVMISIVEQPFLSPLLLLHLYSTVLLNIPSV